MKAPCKNTVGAKSDTVSKSGKHNNTLNIIATVTGLLISIVLLPVIVMNITIFVKSQVNPDEVADFFGIKPFIIETGSMSGTLEYSDLIIVTEVDPETLREGDIISYKENSSVVTHRITEVILYKGELAFITKGDSNNSQDKDPVLASQVEGIYQFTVPVVGKIAVYLREPLWMMILIGAPVLCIVIYDTIMRRITDKRNRETEEKMYTEIQRLRSELSSKKDKNL